MKRIVMPLWKRALSVTLAGALAVTMCPAAAMADETADNPASIASDEGQPSGGENAGTESGTTTDPATPETPSTPETPETPVTPVTPENPDTPTTPDTPATPETPAVKPSTPAKPKPKPKKVTVAFKTGYKMAGSTKWRKAKLGTVMGKTVTTKTITAVRIYNQCKNIKGSIKYSVYQTGKGWSAWKKDGKAAGTGRTKNAVQGLRVKLTSELAKQYNVYYRVNLVGIGWTGWGKNGEKVGAPKIAKVKAYQVKLVKKSNKATNKKFTKKSARKNRTYTGKSRFEMKRQMAMAEKAQGLSSATDWLILTDLSTNRVAIFKGKKGAWQLKKFYVCTSGAPGTRTIRGKFTIGMRGLSFGEDKGYSCWYWTQFCGDFLFHSVKYYPGSMRAIQDGRLGVYASHGCVRLAIGNAKWINRNIPSGTKVWVY